MIRFTILATNNQIEPCLDEVEVYERHASGGTPPRNVAAASGGGSSNGVVGVPGRSDPQDRSSQ